MGVLSGNDVLRRFAQCMNHTGAHDRGKKQLFLRRYEPDQVHGFGLAISAHTMWAPRSDAKYS